jgi:mannose-6-phosphate isomerase-like protein (cupin superfamily)
MKAINLKEKLNSFSDYWNPRIVGRLNGQVVKVAKFKGEFIWHKHDEEDELFQLISGQMKIAFRDKTVILNPGELIIVPRGVEHKPMAEEECEVMLFEPESTLNTGDQDSDLKRDTLEEI